MQVLGAADSDDHELAELMRRLKDDLRHVDADAVRHPAVEAPPGAKGAALDATRRLVTQADLAGASLLERHTFLERYCEAVVRALQQRHTERAELVGARRLFARLRQVTLEAADARAAA